MTTNLQTSAVTQVTAEGLARIDVTGFRVTFNKPDMPFAEFQPRWERFCARLKWLFPNIDMSIGAVSIYVDNIHLDAMGAVQMAARELLA